MKRWILNNLWLKIFTLILATTLWFYIHLENTKFIMQKTFDNIPIRLVANRDKLLLANYQIKISPQEISVRLQGERSQIEKVTPNDLKALVDISDVSGAAIYDLPVKILLPENIEAVRKKAYPSSCQVIIRAFEAPSE